MALLSRKEQMYVFAQLSCSLKIYTCKIPFNKKPNFALQSAVPLEVRAVGLANLLEINKLTATFHRKKTKTSCYKKYQH
jgi:hypothetical protein